MKKRPMGRPPLPAGEDRGSIITLRVKGRERKAIDRAAKGAGKSLSEWLRATIFLAAGIEVDERDRGKS